ncbi:MAG TPA: hypothetical protein VGN02_09905 [Paenibacillus sp.]
MFPYMGWILISYGLAAAMVHLVHGQYLRMQPRSSKRMHYVLVTHNHEQQMEWYLRALSWYGRWRGHAVKVTVLDEASEDNTIAIAERLGHQSGMELKLARLAAVSEEDMKRYMLPTEEQQNEVEHQLYIDLRSPGEANKIPYVHV